MLCLILYLNEATMAGKMVKINTALEYKLEVGKYNTFQRRPA